MKSKENIWQGRRKKYLFNEGKQIIKGEIILGSLPVLKVA